MTTHNLQVNKNNMAATRGKLAAGSASFSHLEGDSIPQEYHIKILKKIAQLTKVIYALNTKSDQHEEVVEQLRGEHTKEIENVKTENAGHLKKLKESYQREAEHAQNRVTVLQAEVSSLEREKSSLESKVRSWEDKTQALLNEHSSEVTNLRSQLDAAQGETRTKQSEVEDLNQTLQSQLAKEKALKLKCKNDIEHVTREKNELLNKMEQNHVKHKEEIMLLTTENAQLQQDLLKLKQESIAERQGAIEYQEEKWKEQKKMMETEYHQAEEALKSKISSLSTELRSTKDNLALSEGKIRELESELAKTKQSLAVIESKMLDASSEQGGLNETISKLQLDLDIANSQYDQQLKELKTLAGNLGKLEALRITHQDTIKELKNEVASLKEKIRWLENEREDLKNSNTSMSEQQAQSMRSLEKEFEKLSKEKQRLHSQYALEIEAAHAQCSQQEFSLINEHKKAIQSTEELHQKKLQEAKEDTEKQLNLLRDELEATMEIKVTDLTNTHQTQLSQVEEKFRKAQSDLHAAKCEVKRLQKLTEENEKGLGSASSHIQFLQNDLRSSEQTLASLKQELEKSKAECQGIQNQFNLLHQQHSCCAQEAQKMINTTKKALTEELDKTWSERLKNMSSSLRAELEKRHKESSDSALAELALLKDKILKEESEKWNHQKTQLAMQVSHLEKELKEATELSKVTLSEKEQLFLNEKQQILKELEEEKRIARQTKELLVNAHSKELAIIEKEHKNQLKALEATLNANHKDELKELKMASKVSTDALREQLHKQGLNEIHILQERHQSEMALAISEVEKSLTDKLNALKADHKKEIENYQKKLQDLAEKKEAERKELSNRITALERQLQEQVAVTKQGNVEIAELKRAVKDLNHEMELKVQQILSIRRESNVQLQQREQELLKTHKAELKSAASYHEQKTQLLLAEFNKAKDILSQELVVTKEKLQEMKIKYKNREPRPEDLDQIRQWKNIAREQEVRIKEIMAEKRFYQLELVNREQNYNKIFNANPIIGVLDPLQAKKKFAPKDDVSTRHSSAPSLVSPLQPNPPLHRPLGSPLVSHKKKEKLVSSSQMCL